tara:strand:- start:26 stop:286 length:261 start_codon:yes stop_codon:yes gene_type:complete
MGRYEQNIVDRYTTSLIRYNESGISPSDLKVAKRDLKDVARSNDDRASSRASQLLAQYNKLGDQGKSQGSSPTPTPAQSYKKESRP